MLHPTKYDVCLRFWKLTFIKLLTLSVPRVHSIFKDQLVNVNDALIILLYSLLDIFFKTESFLHFWSKLYSVITCYYFNTASQAVVGFVHKYIWPLLFLSCTVSCFAVVSVMCLAYKRSELEGVFHVWDRQQVAVLVQRRRLRSGTCESLRVSQETGPRLCLRGKVWRLYSLAPPCVFLGPIKSSSQKNWQLMKLLS